ncbi:flippase-like domain-containing protein [Candidatus Acetothermia bacterium]|jgi:uncharacterized protein (TIRG00374 family)|nr:flippase-like domain-containing protein [Candidatus Acetothermia bacterium]MCI2431548.1 flippase-like domain-containing protein [Candidatus Acetothermia bacterium]MCI2437153.1 flippase-like domain-containing protein [Candidatus Acetothermia bacterium]
MRRRSLVIASILVGLGLLGGILYYIGPERVWEQIARLGIWGYLSLVAIAFLTMICWASSWWVILRAYGIRVGWWTTWWARLSGFAITYLTPSMYFGGEPASVFLIVRGQAGEQRATRVVATLLVSKLLEGLSLLAFVYLGFYYAAATRLLPLDEMGVMIVGNLIFALFVALAAINFMGRRFWCARFLGFWKRHLPWKHALEVAEIKVREVEEDVHHAFREHHRATWAAFLLNLIATFLLYLRPQVFFLFALRAFMPISHLSIAYALFVLLGAFFWVTPGGMGILEGGMVGIFSLVSLLRLGDHSWLAIPQESAVAFALTLKSIEFPMVGLGLFYLIRVGFLKVPKPPLRR